MSNVALGSIPPTSQEPSSLNLAQAFEPSRPVLPRYIGLYQTWTKISEKATHNVIDQLENASHQVQSLCNTMLDRMQELASRTWAQQAWAYLEEITNALASLCNLFAGVYLVSSGDFANGTAFIAAGVCHALQIVFRHTGIWDKICEDLAEKTQAKKEYLKRIIPILAFFINLGFSFYVAKSCSLTTTYPHLLALLRHLRSYLLSTKGVQAFQSYLSIQKSLSDASQSKLQGEIKYQEQYVDLLSRLLEATMREMRLIKSAIKKPINTLMQATTLASQKV